MIFKSQKDGSHEERLYVRFVSNTKQIPFFRGISKYPPCDQRNGSTTTYLLKIAFKLFQTVTYICRKMYSDTIYPNKFSHRYIISNASQSKQTFEKTAVSTTGFLMKKKQKPKNLYTYSRNDEIQDGRSPAKHEWQHGGQDVA